MSWLFHLPFRIAFDVGGVTFLDEAQGPSQECLDAMREIVHMIGVSNAFIVSRARHRRQRKILRTFLTHDVFQRTGIDPRNCSFCLNRQTTQSGDLRFYDVKGAAISGPRYTEQGLGKGVVANFFNISMMIDD